MSSLSAVRRARREGVKAGMFRLKTIWPFPEETLRNAAKNARTVLVPEMNLGQLAYEVERAVGCRVPVVRVGKVNGDLFRPDEIHEKIMEAVK